MNVYVANQTRKERESLHWEIPYFWHKGRMKVSTLKFTARPLTQNDTCSTLLTILNTHCASKEVRPHTCLTMGARTVATGKCKEIGEECKWSPLEQWVLWKHHYICCVDQQKDSGRWDRKNKHLKIQSSYPICLDYVRTWEEYAGNLTL